MSFRTVVISKRCKLDLRMNYMEIRGEDCIKILLDDMQTLMIANPAISLTGCLLEALVDKKIKVIFCDNKRNPQSELIPCNGSHDCSRKLKQQIAWKENDKGLMWTKIVAEKIIKQSQFLSELGHNTEADMLLGYIDELEFADITNREGHAAKVYFNKVFGMGFTRTQLCPNNAALDYGYSLLLSTFNREIVANGYMTQFGLSHDNIYNHFNLSCDLMEPYRILVDRLVQKSDFIKFESEEKRIMLTVLEQEILIKGTIQTIPNAIKIYVKSVFNALQDNNMDKVMFYEL